MNSFLEYPLIENQQDSQSIMDALKYVGYSFNEAISELVDNSVDSGANVIHINISNSDGSRGAKARAERIEILDNGSGMNRDSLNDCLTIGSISKSQSSSSLGGFGMGLKTSCNYISDLLKIYTSTGEVGEDWFSQVNFRKLNKDSDFVYRQSQKQKNYYRDKWKSKNELYFGTLIVLEKLNSNLLGIDGLIGHLKKDLSKRFCKIIRDKSIKIYVNNILLKSDDPVVSNKTREIFKETLSFKGHEIKILAHEYLKKSYREVGAKQGFHFYRNDRSILHEPSTMGLFIANTGWTYCVAEISFPKELEGDFGIHFAKNSINPSSEVYNAISKTFTPFFESYCLEKNKSKYLPVDDSIKAIVNSYSYQAEPDEDISFLEDNKKSPNKKRSRVVKKHSIEKEIVDLGKKERFLTYSFIAHENRTVLKYNQQSSFSVKYVRTLKPHKSESDGLDIECISRINSYKTFTSTDKASIIEGLENLENQILNAWLLESSSEIVGGIDNA